MQSKNILEFENMLEVLRITIHHVYYIVELEGKRFIPKIN